MSDRCSNCANALGRADKLSCCEIVKALDFRSSRNANLAALFSGPYKLTMLTVPSGFCCNRYVRGKEKENENVENS